MSCENSEGWKLLSLQIQGDPKKGLKSRFKNANPRIIATARMPLLLFKEAFADILLCGKKILFCKFVVTPLQYHVLQGSLVIAALLLLGYHKGWWFYILIVVSVFRRLRVMCRCVFVGCLMLWTSEKGFWLRKDPFYPQNWQVPQWVGGTYIVLSMVQMQITRSKCILGR